MDVLRHTLSKDTRCENLGGGYRREPLPDLDDRRESGDSRTNVILNSIQARFDHRNLLTPRIQRRMIRDWPNTRREVNYRILNRVQDDRGIKLFRMTTRQRHTYGAGLLRIIESTTPIIRRQISPHAVG